MFRSSAVKKLSQTTQHRCYGVNRRAQSVQHPIHALRDTRPKSKRLTGFGPYHRQPNQEVVTESSRDTFNGMKVTRDEITPDEAYQYIGERWVQPIRGRSGVAPLQEGSITSQGQPLNDEASLFCYNFNSGRVVTMKSRFGQATLKSVTQAIDIYTNNGMGGSLGANELTGEKDFASNVVPELYPHQSPDFYRERRYHPDTLDQVQEYKKTPKYYNSVWNREPAFDSPAVMIFNSVTPGEGLTSVSKVGANQWMLRRKLYELTYLFYEQMEKRHMYEAHRADQSPADGDSQMGNMDTCPVNVSILNGPLVGSGACLSLFHKYVIATPGTSYTCPDIFAGRIPNNGNLYILSKLNDLYPGFGTWLGLSGARLNLEDMIALGMVTHYSEVPGLGEQIMRRLDEKVQLPTEEELKNVLAEVTEHPGAWNKKKRPRFHELLHRVEEAFGDLGDVPSLMAGNRDIPFLNEIFDNVKHRGDTVAAACFLQAMKFAKDMDVHQIMNMEYRLMAHLSSRLDQPEHERRNDIGLGDFFDKHPEVPDIYLPEQLYLFKSKDDLNPASEAILGKLKLKSSQ